MQETIPNALRRCADPVCGLEFTPRTRWQKYHSPRCRTRHWEATHARRANPAPALTCPHCGAPLVLALQPVVIPPVPSAARRPPWRSNPPLG